jgi:hypothetical protein
MKRSGWFAVTLFVMYLSNSDASFAAVRVDATWQIDISAQSFTAYANTEADALVAARAQCVQAQTLDRYRLFCSNAPTRVFYGVLPNGSYLQPAPSAEWKITLWSVIPASL